MFDKIIQLQTKYREKLLLVLVLLLSLLGTVSLVVAASSQMEAPIPPQNVSQRDNNIPTDKIASPSQSVIASAPVSISIPRINVQSEVKDVGNNPDNSIEVPAGGNYDKAAWYKHSATPGENGTSIILGHVDSYKSGPSVFFRLGELRKGDKIHVSRQDGTSFEFIIESISSVEKKDFPSDQVYTNTPAPTLRLITCGGEFNKSNGEYRNNIIVSAHIVNESGKKAAEITHQGLKI